MRDDCATISALLDAYLSSELSPMEEARVDAHVESCSDCARETQASKNVKTALADALRDEVPVDGVRERILAAIEASTPARSAARQGPSRRVASLAAALAVGAALTFAFTRPGVERDDSIYSDSFLSHAACAVMRQVPVPPTREQALTRLGPYRELLEEIPVGGEGLELVDAHICPGRAREFGHVVLRVDGEVVSLLVTDKSRGSLPPGDGTAHAGAVDVQTVSFPIFELAGFESRRFMGFVVTPRPELEAARVASRLAPGALRALGDLDGTR